MRADSGVSPGPSDTNGEGDGELAFDPEGRSGDVEHAPRATTSAAKVRGQTRRGGTCLATPRTLSASAGFVGSSRTRCQAAVGRAGLSTRQIAPAEGLEHTVCQVPLVRGPGKRQEGGTGKLEFDEHAFGAIGGGVRLQSDAFDETSASYDIHVDGGASRLTIGSC